MWNLTLIKIYCSSNLQLPSHTHYANPDITFEKKTAILLAHTHQPSSKLAMILVITITVVVAKSFYVPPLNNRVGYHQSLIHSKQNYIVHGTHEGHMILPFPDRSQFSKRYLINSV